MKNNVWYIPRRTNNGNLFTSPKTDSAGHATAEEWKEKGYILFGETDQSFDDCPEFPEGDQETAKAWREKCAKRIKMIQNGNDEYHLAKDALKNKKMLVNARICGLREKARTLICHNMFDKLHTEHGLDKRLSLDYFNGGGAPYLEYLAHKTKEIEEKATPFEAAMEQYFDSNPVTETMDEAMDHLFSFAKTKKDEINFDIWGQNIYNYGCCNEASFPDPQSPLRDVLVHLKQSCNYNRTAIGRQKWGLRNDGIAMTLERYGFKTYRTSAIKDNVYIKWKLWTDGSIDSLKVRVFSSDTRRKEKEQK